MTRNQRSYYAVIRELKSQYGVTHTQARKIRSALTDKLGSVPRLKDLKEHPIITKRIVKKETRKGGGGGGVRRPKKIEIDSIDKWNDYLDDYDGDFVDYEYDDTGEYKEG